MNKQKNHYDRYVDKIGYTIPVRAIVVRKFQLLIHF
jgi:hypothetical protein